MPHYRVSESIPCEFGCFDLVIVDEASQSDLTALPALLRAEKVLIVGDDKQVSPEGIGLEGRKGPQPNAAFLEQSGSGRSGTVVAKHDRAGGEDHLEQVIN